jgi:hypothetical protein
LNTAREASQAEDDGKAAPSPATTASQWKRGRGISLQAQFEHVVALFLSGLIALVVVLAV